MNWLSYIGVVIIMISLIYIAWQLIMKVVGLIKHNDSHKRFKKIGIALICFVVGFGLALTYKETKSDIAADKKEARIESSKKISEKASSKKAKSESKAKFESKKHVNSVSESKSRAESTSKAESSKKVKAKKAKAKKESRAESRAKKESKAKAKKESSSAKAAKVSSKKAAKSSAKVAKTKQIQKNFSDYKTYLTTVPNKTKNAITDAYLDNTSEVTIFVLNDDALSLNSNELKTVTKSAWNTGNQIVNNYTPFPSKDENYKRITIEDSAGNRIAHTSLFGSFKYDAD